MRYVEFMFCAAAGKANHGGCFSIASMGAARNDGAAKLTPVDFDS